MLLDSYVASTIIGLLLFCGVYGFPSILAYTRHHHNRAAIIATNLLMGWTVIGWMVSLIWALTNPAPTMVPYDPRDER